MLPLSDSYIASRLAWGGRGRVDLAAEVVTESHGNHVHGHTPDPPLGTVRVP
jgi:hypothetical protein